MAENRTPTETLMACLESFGEDEPLEVIVVYSTQSGDLCWSCSSSVYSHKIGMLENAKAHIQKQMLDYTSDGNKP